MKRIPPRMEAALNAVPAAVLTTLVAPAFFNGGIDVKVAMVVGTRSSACVSPRTTMLVAGWVVVMAWRHFVGA